jgi:two-component system alkaline phosphatase synthesis response regulator PhoP
MIVNRGSGSITFGGIIMAERRVLVVDDEMHIVHVVAIKLRNNGYEVITANNGAEALELARQENPDIVVTDYQMPVMSGLELVKELRGDDITKSIPVILLTARSFAISKEEQEALRISTCLSKPFSPRELLGDIEDILHKNELVVES